MAALRETERKAWKAWASAKAACDQGLIARPLLLFVEATELAPPAVYLDAAEFALNLNRGLERLASIYQRHARSFGLAPDTYPIYLPGIKIGPEGWEFVLNCLLAANAAAPSRLDVQEKIADFLEERGRFGEALAWRQGVQTVDPQSDSNSMAIARLFAKTGRPADAEAHYLRIQAQRPDKVEVLLRLVSIFPAEKAISKFFPAIDRVDRALKLKESKSDIEYQVFILSLILEMVRQWPFSPSRELLRRLRRRCDGLMGSNQSSVSVLLADALLAMIESDFARSARSRLCKATIELQRVGTSVETPEETEAVAEAANYARVLISNPGFPSREREPLPAINVAVLAREQARTLLADERAGDALLRYAASLKAYYVTDVPTQYELVGDHKLVLHEQCYYAFPRDIQEFIIREGTVYRLTGIGRHTTRRIPPWMLSLLFPYLGRARKLAANVRVWKARVASVGGAVDVEYGQWIFRSVARAGRIGRISARAIARRGITLMRWINRAVPRLERLLGPAVELACEIWFRLLRRKSAHLVWRPRARGKSRLWYRPWPRFMMKGQRDRFIRIVKHPTYNLKRMAFKISWRRYAVPGVVTAQSREAALALIAEISNVPIAADRPSPRIVQRARLTCISALGPEP